MLRFLGFVLLSVSAVAFAAHKERANAASASAMASQSRYRMVYMSERAQKPGAATTDTQIVVADSLGNGAATITSGGFLHVYPRIDASGETVAAAEGKDERTLSIVTHNLKTGVVEQWTGANGMNIHPRFSGNSRYLAFSGPLGPGGKAQIGIIDLDSARTSARREGTAPGVVRYEVSPRVISSEYDCYFPALSSDGSFVVFQRTKSAKEKDIVLYDLIENQLQALTTTAGEWKSPSLSFDDRQVAYAGNVGGKWHIYVTDLLNKRTVQLTNGSASDLSPSFRPDGSLVFSSFACDL